MECYVHPGAAAIGICKYCQKGLCRECAVDTGVGISCRGKCEDEVKAIKELLAREKGVYGKAASASYRTGLVLCLMGLAFIVWSMAGHGGSFTAVFGSLILVAGLMGIYSGWKWRRSA